MKDEGYKEIGRRRSIRAILTLNSQHVSVRHSVFSVRNVLSSCGCCSCSDSNLDSSAHLKSSTPRESYSIARCLGPTRIGDGRDCACVNI